MKIAAWTLTLLLTAAAAGAMAASPEALWQEYQKHPGYVATEPVKPTPREAPRVTVENTEGVANAPTTPEQAKAKAEAQPAPASQQESVPQTQPAPASQQQAAQPKAKQAAAANQPAAPQEQQSPAPQGAAKAAAPVVSSRPAAKRAPKPSLLPKRPLPRQYMRTPQAGDFASATSERGGYSLQLPKAFGSDPLAALPGAEGPMLVRSAGNTLLCAATVLDAADTASFRQQPLPEYKDKELYACWLQNADLEWTCSLSTHEDYYGSKLLLEASAQQHGKTYQLLYVLPLQDFGVYLPQALFSLHSFKLLPAK